MFSLGKSRSIASSDGPDICTLAEYVWTGAPDTLTLISLDRSSLLIGEAVGICMSMGCAS